MSPYLAKYLITLIKKKKTSSFQAITADKG